MLKINDILQIINDNSNDLTYEFKRLFHGRGNFYSGYSFLTVDSIGNILNIAFYYEIDIEIEKELMLALKNYITKTQHNTIVLQRRYIHKTTSEVIIGNINNNLYVIENNIKIKINLLSNQNNGYFPDMKIGREFVKNNSKDKKVLNLFSYTCAFSLAAVKGGAKEVTNVDMSKNALTIGRANHHLNEIDTKNINFMPYNILKSFSRIKKKAPYDLIIIDPPTFQKGSFVAVRDYEKIIKKLEQISSYNCIILACLNSSNLDSEFIIELFNKYTSNFKFIQRLDNITEFRATNDERSLKNLVFQRVVK